MLPLRILQIPVALGLLLYPVALLKSPNLYLRGTMSIEPEQFRELIVRPVLIEGERDGFKGFNSLAAEELLMLTAAQETHLGRWLRQVGRDGNYAPGRGIYSMEPTTFEWLDKKYNRPISRSPEDLVWDLRLATKMARLRYWVVKEPLPAEGNIEGMARYWDRYYNGNPNVGFPEEAVANYRRYVLEKDD